MMTTSFWDLLKAYKVVVPIIQRDYAQGRVTGKVPQIRDNILNAFSVAIKSKGDPLELDFVYGYTKINKSESNGELKLFYPLDGQQRLTTLFLLHWYIAAKEGHHQEAIPVLAKFTYETRHSSRVFCSKLVEYAPDSFALSIRQSIINQPWFFTAWNNDPTINSMLTMLDAIQAKVATEQLANVWPALTGKNAPIVFHLLPLEKLGLPDDLYIKMNSRGKELTEFEHFKIRFGEMLNPDLANEFNHKIDQAWSDLFWDLNKEAAVADKAQLVDAAFLRFFRYVTNIILAGSDNVAMEAIDEYVIFRLVYSIEKNVKLLFSILDTFVQVYQANRGFFSSVFYIDAADYAVQKTRLFFVNSAIDLFKKCSDSYDATLRVNPFSIGEQLLLYACITHLQEQSIEFNVRIRKLRNLISNSEDTVRKENLPSLLASVYGLIVRGILDNDTKFNTTQSNEEDDKTSFLQTYPDLLDTVCRLEDHHLLQGCIAVFKLMPDLVDYANQYHKVFRYGCDYNLISCAMLALGDYSQKTGWSRRLGNKNNSVWRELFTPSQRRGDFLNTQTVLSELLGRLHRDPTLTLATIISSYLEQFNTDCHKERDWKYYYVRYPDFRKHDEGYYYWPDPTKQLECIMMRRKTLGGFHWDPFLLAIKNSVVNNLSLENYGAPLIYVRGNAALKIRSKTAGFTIETVDTDSQALINSAVNAGIITDDQVCVVRQSASGLDIENRVERGMQLISSLNSLAAY